MMRDATRKQMSDILKEMALTVLVVPDTVPSSEAAGAALLLSHVAWQRANGDDVTFRTYDPVLAGMQRSNPDFWKELTSCDREEIVAQLVAYKTLHYPDDKRRIVSCGTYNNKVRVEWTD